MQKKKFKLLDAVLLSVVVVLVLESTASTAAIGPSQFFWWIVFLLLFFLPYGLVSSELGTTYEGEGGLYDWVKKAFGKRAGGRVAWYYWINYPIWMGSLAILFTDTMFAILQIEVNNFIILIVQLIFIWGVCLITLTKISDAKWILNSAALMKAFIMLTLGIVGIYYLVTQGSANEISFQTLLPTFDSKSLIFLSVIIFNFLGFEVVASLAPEMENPQKDIPKALILGGILIAIFYLFGAFGITVAIPVGEIAPDAGFLDSFNILLPGATIFIAIIGAMFMWTLISNLISWAYGVNSVALYCAKDGSLPKMFGTVTKKNGLPLGVVILNGIVASVVVISKPLVGDGAFWSFFALNIVTLLASYLYMFPAFLKLRKIDGDRQRPFKVKGSKAWLTFITYSPFILIVFTLLLTLFPLPDLFIGGSTDFMNALPLYIPLIIGTIIAIIAGEIIVSSSMRKTKRKE